MSVDPETPKAIPEARVLTPQAERALAEAQDRRRQMDEKEAALKAQAEIKGRGGLDPVRYEDWEIKGIASDF